MPADGLPWLDRSEILTFEETQRLVALFASVVRIADAPGRWPLHRHGTRACRLARFPYLVIYDYADEVVRVIAVAHAGRNPGYWRRRVS